MKWVRSLLKSLFFFVLGAVVAAFAGITAVSYYAVEHLSAAHAVSPEPAKKKTPEDSEEALPDTWLNANIIEVLRLGDQYTVELNEFDQLQSQVKAQPSPPLCEVICGASSFDSTRMLEERTPYLKNFYQQNGERSLRDPFFQLKLREVGFLADIFSTSARELWVDFEKHQTPEASTAQKLSWSLKFEFAALKELYRLSGRWEELKKESSRIQSYRDLIRSCQQGLRPAKDLRSECEQL